MSKTINGRVSDLSIEFLLRVAARAGISIALQTGRDAKEAGAFALSAHAVVRASSAVEALLDASYTHLKKITTTFEAAGFSVALRRGDEDDPILSMLILSDTHSNRVELLGGLRGLDPKVFSRAIEVPFHGVNLRIVGREDFIAMKCFVGTPQDLAEARAAFDGAQGPVDLDLLRAVTRRFGRDAAERLEALFV